MRKDKTMFAFLFALADVVQNAVANNPGAVAAAATAVALTGSALVALMRKHKVKNKELAEQLGVDCTNFSGAMIPIIFNVTFQDPAGYFLATKLDMRPFDVIYVANAPQVDVTKFLDFLNTAIGTADNGAHLVADIYTARQLSKLP